MHLNFFRSPDGHETNAGNTLARNAETQSVLNKLKQWQLEKNARFGHQDSLAYGNNWHYENGYINELENGNVSNDGSQYESGKSDIFDITNHFPMIFGWDLGNYYDNKNYLINGVLKEDLVSHIQFVHSIGGINTISWHCQNPVTNGEFSHENDANFYGGNVINSISEAGVSNQRFNNIILGIYNFLKQPEIAHIPIIFRPFHESNLSDTFWWDKSVCSNDNFIELWRVIHDFLYARLPNLLFCYSINDVWHGNTAVDNNFKQQVKNEFSSRYPGDQYVDIFGVDLYQKNGLLPYENDDNFINRIKLSVAALNEINTTKPIAISETGSYSPNHTNWWTNNFTRAMNNTPCAYALIWRNPCVFKDPNSKGFGPFIGSSTEDDFIQFYNNNSSKFI